MMQAHMGGPCSVMRVLGVWGIVGLVILAIPQLSPAESPLTNNSGRGERFTRPVLQAFTEQTGIAVRMQTGSSAALLAKLR